MQNMQKNMRKTRKICKKNTQYARCFITLSSILICKLEICKKKNQLTTSSMQNLRIKNQYANYALPTLLMESEAAAAPLRRRPVGKLS